MTLAEEERFKEEGVVTEELPKGTEIKPEVTPVEKTEKKIRKRKARKKRKVHERIPQTVIAKKDTLVPITLGISIIILILLGYGVFVLFNLSDEIEKRELSLNNIDAAFGTAISRAEELKKASIPAKIEILSITDSSCSDCFNTKTFIDAIKQNKLNITSERNVDRNSAEGIELIKKYSINKIPTVLLSGELNKTNILAQLNQLGTIESDSVFILRKIDPIYLDLNINKYVGRVFITFLTDSSCPMCYNIQVVRDSIAQSGVVIAGEKIIDISSEEGKAIIERYNITKVPTMVFSEDANAYTFIKESWNRIGTVESDGQLVARVINPPYKDVRTNRVYGLVTLTNIIDNSCPECYNVSIHKDILKGMGVFIANETTMDVSSEDGKVLIQKYNITKIPTILSSDEIKAYDGVMNVLRQVGTIESDGTFVFRQIEVLRSNYKDLTNNTIIRPQATSG